MSNTDSLSTGSQRLRSTDLVDVARLEPARRQQVGIIAQGVNVRNSDTFGAGPQRKLSGFLEKLLADTRAEGIALIGELAAEFATSIKPIDLPALRREADGRASMLASLPIVGQYYSALRRLRAMQTKVVEQLAAIEQKAGTHLSKTKASNAGLDRLLDATENNLRELEAWVAGGQQALARMRTEQEAERTALGDVNDPAGLATLRDTAEQIDAFETRLVRMQAVFTHGALCIPQVRSAQQAGRSEIQNTLDTVLLDLPDLKSAILRVAAPGDIAADVAVLSRVNDKILAMLEHGVATDRENGAKREQAVQQLGELRLRLMEGLRSHADEVRQPQGTEFR